MLTFEKDYQSPMGITGIELLFELTARHTCYFLANISISQIHLSLNYRIAYLEDFGHHLTRRFGASQSNIIFEKKKETASEQ